MLFCVSRQHVSWFRLFERTLLLGEKKRKKNPREPYLSLNIFNVQSMEENAPAMNMLHILCGFIVTHIAIFVENPYVQSSE